MPYKFFMVTTEDIKYIRQAYARWGSGIGKQGIMERILNLRTKGHLMLWTFKRDLPRTCFTYLHVRSVSALLRSLHHRDRSLEKGPPTALPVLCMNEPSFQRTVEISRRLHGGKMYRIPNNKACSGYKIDLANRDVPLYLCIVKSGLKTLH